MTTDSRSFNVKTEAFDGPLDLLLHLIEKHELDIFDIPIALITDQYLLHMRSMDGLEMDALSEFLVMAATLLHIKARMLLPEDKPADDTESGGDPREELVAKLLYYKRFKELAEELANSVKTGDKALYKDRDQTIDWEEYGKNARNVPITGIVPISKLRDIFMDLLLRQESRTDKIRGGFNSVPRERFTVSDRIKHITSVLKKRGKVSFAVLIGDNASKDEAITTFLALLELIRLDQVSVMQDGLFNEIVCCIRENI